MKAYGAQQKQLLEVIREIGYRPRAGTAGGIAIFASKEDGSRRMACPHEYQECIEAMLRRYPHVRLETHVATYYGLEDFLETKEATLVTALRIYKCRVEHVSVVST
jgi:hypothetical protein